MKLELYYPVSPLHVNQVFGNDPVYYAKFKDVFGNPEKGHNGVDFMAAHGEPVYAAMDGTAFYLQPDINGGQGVYIRSDQPYDYANGSCWFNTIYWHLIGDTDPAFPPPIPLHLEQTKVQIGDLIGYANNTGAPNESNGDHLHFGLQPVDSSGRATNPGNGYGGCIDPQPYFNGKFSVNILIGLYRQVLDLAQKILAKMQGK